MTRKIMLDTNFLVAPFQLSIDLFEEIDRVYPVNEVYTLEDAVQEAKSIEEGRYKSLVEKLIETQDIEVLETEHEETSSSRTVEEEGEVDDLLVNICDEFVIATNDRELKDRLVERGAEVLFIRSGDHLEVLNSNELGI
ncbi:MAG: PIN domain-containing protein [Candidatus Nanohalobium sp.]